MDEGNNTVSYQKSLRIKVFESLEGFKMYYVIGASVSFLHRESTDSLVHSTHAHSHSHC